LDSTCRTQAKIRIRQATFAETLKVKVRLAGHEMLPFYGITDIWVLREAVRVKVVAAQFP